ncbi:hypothetical protein CKC_03575 [Candidatus Liberibacter solanacearum CLso-ZC1]|uniref:Outer membrane protein beta-barrel domain-containing protein n=1 Tax=Liberibacter solanacearum (strain CLso-ZC1) TaxID=658172 RepID=E4UBF8_LIBSC|nr:outer membrane beta-barrel protein [Candidatus Liberibacter solanacearum]ADR52464.1 hypothetical protein CKC_03575 [Candidatus Liberibacter solanacearum CLso-ZC1]
MRYNGYNMFCFVFSLAMIPSYSYALVKNINVPTNKSGNYPGKSAKTSNIVSRNSDNDKKSIVNKNSDNDKDSNEKNFDNRCNNIEYLDDEYGIWEGIHVGINFSSQHYNQAFYYEPYNKAKSSFNKYKVGIDTGYDLHTEDFVYGLRFSSNFSKGLEANAKLSSDQALFHRMKAGYSIYGDALFRAGYSVDSVLVYGLGGLGGTYIGNSTLQKIDKEGSGNHATKFSGYGVGIVLGVGVDYMIWDNISVTTSYRYAPHSIRFNNISKDASETIKEINGTSNAHIISLGLSMHLV